jgi:hypothetical protein
MTYLFGPCTHEGANPLHAVTDWCSPRWDIDFEGVWAFATPGR